MATNVIEGDLVVRGTVYGENVIPSDNTVVNAKIPVGAKIDPKKLGKQLSARWSQAGTATAETRVIHEVRGLTGVIREFRALSIVKAVGDSTVTIDLRKNGTTVLSAPITLNSSNSNRVAVGATVTTAAVAQGDVLEVVVTVSAGTGTLPTGVSAAALIDEDPLV